MGTGPVAGKVLQFRGERGWGANMERRDPGTEASAGDGRAPPPARGRPSGRGHPSTPPAGAGLPATPTPTRKLPGTGCEAGRRPKRLPGAAGVRRRGRGALPRPFVTWAALRRRHGCVCSGGRAALRGGAWLGGVAADCAFGGARRPRGRGPGGPAPAADQRTLPPFSAPGGAGPRLPSFRPPPAGRGPPRGPDLRAPAARLSPGSM